MEWELMREKENLEKRLSYLSQVVETISHESKGSDVYTHDEKRTRGSKSEIDKIRNRINAINQELSQIKAYKQKYAEEGKRKDAEQLKMEKEEAAKRKEEAARKKQIRLDSFNDVKKTYKKTKGHKWDRFVRKIQGKSPNWRKIKAYSQEELDYLLATKRGETYRQEYRGANGWDKRGVDNAEKNWDDFANLLNSKFKIDQGIKKEQEEGRHL